LEIPFTTGDNEVRHPGVVVEDKSLRAVAAGKGDHLSVGVQLSFEVLHLVGKGKVAKGILLLLLLNGDGEALGNVKDSGWVVTVELYCYGST
jgi:hypothetical protein